MELFSTWSIKCWNINSAFFKPQLRHCSKATCSCSVSKILCSSRWLKTCLPDLCCLHALLGNRVVSEICQGPFIFHNSPKNHKKGIMVLEEQGWITKDMTTHETSSFSWSMLWLYWQTDCANFRSLSKIQCHFYCFFCLFREISNVTFPVLSPAWNGEHREGFE